MTDKMTDESGQRAGFDTSASIGELSEKVVIASKLRAMASVTTSVLFSQRQVLLKAASLLDNEAAPPAPSVAITNAFMRGANYICNNLTMLDSPDLVVNTANAATEYALSAQVQDVAGWQPIETAPKDGTPIWVCNDHYTENGFLPISVRWCSFHPNSPGKECWRDINRAKVARINYWMPLPAAPAAKQGGKPSWRDPTIFDDAESRN